MIDSLRVANKHRAQQVKCTFAPMYVEGHEAHKLPCSVNRQWDTYTVLEEGKNFKIKRTETKPNACISFQMHHHRSDALGGGMP